MPDDVEPSRSSLLPSSSDVHASSRLTLTLFGVAIALFAGIGIFASVNMRRLIETNDSVAHTLTTLRSLDQLFSDLKDAETAARGYLLSAEEDHIEVYQRAIDAVPRDLGQLDQLAVGNPAELGRLARIGSLSKQRLALLEESITSYRARGPDAVAQARRTSQGKAVMDEIRALLDDMMSDGESSLWKEQERARNISRTTNAALLIGYVLGSGLLLLTVINLRREVIAHGRAEEELRKARDELERRVDERTAELALSNQVLENEMREHMRSADSLRNLSGRLLELQDEERRRIARELHDSAGQYMVGILRNLSLIEDSPGQKDDKEREALREALGWVRQCSQEIRTLSYLLHPPMLDELGLISALRSYVDGFSARTGIRVDLTVPEQFDRHPPEEELTLFRIVQETLSNIHRHSGSPRARILIRSDRQELILEVADEGRGIGAAVPDVGSEGIEKLGVGISGMRERMRQLGGRLEIESSEKGTIVRAVMPLLRAEG